MSSTPSHPEPVNCATQRDEDARYCRQVLHELIEIGTDLAPPSPKELASELRAERCRIARKQIIHEVEDLIRRQADGPQAETPHAEFYERLETIDCEDDLDNLPIAEIVALIRRDLGLAHLPGTHPWKRRTPQETCDHPDALLEAGATIRGVSLCWSSKETT